MVYSVLKQTFLLILVSFISLQIQSQDEILTMSGKLIEAKVTEIGDLEIVYDIEKRNGKYKTVTLDRSEVYSIKKADGTMQVFYEMDEDFGDWMTQDEMYVYIMGEKDARENYKTGLLEAVGYTFGGAIGYLSGGGFLVAISAPILYTGFQFIPLIKIKEQHISDKAFAYNEFYLTGFEPVARSKRVISGLKSSLIGTILGTILYYIIPYN